MKFTDLDDCSQKKIARAASDTRNVLVHMAMRRIEIFRNPMGMPGSGACSLVWADRRAQLATLTNLFFYMKRNSQSSPEMASELSSWVSCVSVRALICKCDGPNEGKASIMCAINSRYGPVIEWYILTSIHWWDMYIRSLQNSWPVYHHWYVNILNLGPQKPSIAYYNRLLSILRVQTTIKMKFLLPAVTFLALAFTALADDPLILTGVSTNHAALRPTCTDSISFAQH
jgi:hypothetical protein